MKEKAGIVTSAKFGLIVVLFLLPFVNVSCSGVINIPLTGMNLATGTTVEMKQPFSNKVEKQEFGAEPLATLALFCALAGLAAGFIKARGARLAGAGCGAAGAVLLLLLKNKLDSEVLKQGGGLLSISYEFAFWAAVLLFLAGAGAGLYFFTQLNGGRPSTGE